MSVGGKVTMVVDCGAALWVNTWDGDSQCAVRVEPSPAARCIERGDSLWWQGRDAFWTPKAGGKSDIRLRRIGYSGVSLASALARPDAEAGAP